MCVGYASQCLSGDAAACCPDQMFVSKGTLVGHLAEFFCVCVRVCVRVCEGVCVCARVRACVRL